MVWLRRVQPRVDPRPLALLLLLACSAPPRGAPEPSPEGWRAFQGSWTATGTRHVVALGGARRASTIELTGSLLLTGERGLGVGFQSSVIGFSDTASGFQGRSVWTDERGDEVFSALEGEAVSGGRRIRGTFLGGTGRWAGLTGGYEFQWQYVIEAEDGSVSGRATDLTGRGRLAALPPPGGGTAP